MAFQNKLIQGLYNDALKGRDTDLQVICPTSSDHQSSIIIDSEHDGVSTATFHLHSLIVSSSSNYFATFPEPKTGRVINDVDAPTFEV